MQLIPQLLATAGWTSFSGVFSTVFPLVVVIAVLSLVLGGRKTAPVSSRPEPAGERMKARRVSRRIAAAARGDRGAGRRRCWESACIG